MVWFMFTFIFASFVQHAACTIFPQANPTRVQIIAGFGIPVDLKLESLTIGYVFKAQYFLPYNSSQLYQQNVMGIPIRIQRDNSLPNQNRMFRHNNYKVDNEPWQEYNQEKSSYDNKNSRWILYKSLETLMEMNGFDGHQCVLRGICEVAEKSFSYESGLLSEILQIILSPSNTNDKISHNSEYAYFHAEKTGRIGDPCDRVYSGCVTSPLEMISSKHGPNHFLTLFLATSRLLSLYNAKKGKSDEV